MHRPLALLVTMVLVFASSRVILASCGGTPSDLQALADARAQVQASCDCAGAAAHGDYVRCARAVAALRVAQGLLPRVCKGGVSQCAGRSTCGRPGFATCCRRKASGQTKCYVKPSAASCTAPAGGNACVGAVASCCDACNAGGCVAVSTTTTTSSTTSTTSADACGNTAPACNGSCGAGARCWPEEFPNLGCQCLPDGVTPCIGSPYPQCGGTCPGGAICAPTSITFGSTSYLCACVDPAGVCVPGIGAPSMCPGRCPAGFACGIDVQFPNECLCGPHTPCSGGAAYPACGGSCPAGEACAPAQFGSLLAGQCVCAPAGAPCDATCGGTSCPAGQICRSVLGTGGLTCSCVAP